ncbi:MAG TPA: M56 family metallopeptidase [Thermoanaerobaculia bacterium]|jgi:beta-lactamase regulating signal transducer with metallopeptidase domain|nr:M56 family metallopeptidase [Thermoanaerobaculia bacterium]
MIGSIFSGPVAQSIGWALLHLVWQGAIVAAILAAALALMARRTANARYAISCAALALLPLLAAVTAWRAYEEPPLPLEGGSAVLRTQTLPLDVAKAAAVHATRATLRSFGEVAHDALPNVVLLWLVGVTILSIRLVVSWTRIKKLALNASPATDTWQRTLTSLSDALRLRRGVAILESAAVEVPTVIGWLKPLILLPMSTMSALKPEEIEMLLAHELAHIRRHDFFVNLMQTAVETLMFYHPAVWWISHRIRIEREHCCDDMAIETCGSALRYARALTHLEELRAHQAELALAANGGSLLTRIRRLVTSNDDSASDTSRWGAAAAVLAVVIAVLAIPSMPALAKRNAEQLPTNPPKAVAAKPSTTTITVESKSVTCDKDHDADVDNDVNVDVETPEPPDPPDPPEAPMAMAADMAGTPAPPAPPAIVNVSPRIAIATPRVRVSPMPAIAPMAMAFASDAVDGVLDGVIGGVEGGVKDGIKGGVKGGVAWKVHTRHIGADGKLSVDDLITLRSVGVTPEYIKQMRGTGLGDLSLDDIVAMRSQGVTPEYVSEMRNSGIDIKDARDIVTLRSMGVSPSYIKEMAGAGYHNLSARELVELRSMNVSPAFVKALADAGYTNLSVRDLVRLAASGVNADFIRDMAQYKEKK